jgi:hypothetical protein
MLVRAGAGTPTLSVLSTDDPRIAVAERGAFRPAR